MAASQLLEWTGVIAGVVALIFAYFKLVFLPKKKIKELGEKLEDSKNEITDKQKEIHIVKAKNDHDNAVSQSVVDWVNKWLTRSD